MRRRTYIFALVGSLSGFAFGCTHPDQSAATLPGKELYAGCVACHGEQGEGKQDIAAPPIGGLEAWAVEAQLIKFRAGIRGAHPEDLEGLRMRAMVRQLKTPAEIKAVSEYVSQLKPGTPKRTLKTGDAEAGKISYNTCLACHGVDGQGNKDLNAPSLLGQADWYMVSQLKKFKSGIRGLKPEDVTGQQMRPMAMTLPDDAAIANVVAYIETLKAPKKQ